MLDVQSVKMFSNLLHKTPENNFLLTSNYKCYVQKLVLRSVSMYFFFKENYLKFIQKQDIIQGKLAQSMHMQVLLCQL